MQEYTDKKFWSDYFTKFQPKLVENVIFADIFNKYLIPDSKKSILEIGCAGGDLLVYLSKRFQYQPYGVDYSDKIWTTEKLFKYNGLQKPTLYKEDFFNWNPGRQYDVVCSFGFVEHFDDLKFLIRKHADLVAPEGVLIITMPHFARLQYLFHWLVDKENLRKHNTKIMNLKSLREAFKALPFEIKYLNYYKTFGFWTEKKYLNAFENIIIWKIRAFGKIANKLFGYDRPNSFFSPHIICIAQKNK